MQELSWRDTGDRLELYIRDSGTNGEWCHYRAHRLSVPDYRIPGGSKGFATMQKLLGLGYKLVKVDATATQTLQRQDI